MPSAPIRFGTDGWRGRIGEDYTFAAVRRCAHGFALYLHQSGASGPVVVGYDRRFASESFAAAVAEVLAAHDFRVLLTNSATPTPAIAYAVVHHGAAGAVNITASHNPGSDNGFKVRNATGGAVPPEGLQAIEAGIPDDESQVPRLALEGATASGRVEVFDPAPAYQQQLERLVELDRLRQAGLHLVVDSMWGNGAGWLARLVGGGKSEVVEVHADRNPIFPEMRRPEPIPPNIDAGLEAGRRHAADAVLITDGDADRVGLGDEHGVFVDQLRVYALLAYYFLEVRGERGPIVKTLSTTSMLTKLGERYGVPVYETGVGFKYVAPKMVEVNALLGGEESGGFAFRGHVPERDGLLAGLYLLDLMVRLNKKPSQLVQAVFDVVGEHYYDRIDRALPAEGRAAVEADLRRQHPQEIAGLKVVRLNTLDGYKFELEDGGWLLLRFSGTEPLVRVYCETTDRRRVRPLLEAGLALLGLKP
ncbi:MAG TPA: phosphoglucomutase/phosphomannomutase family protein [Anaerolineales bacterium]|nr:phosphoglucomutase/phosphomannomutase family protein [Anaerolineales bacterium]